MKQLERNDAVKLASPYPYVLASTVDKNGKPNLIGLCWWSYVSWDPMLIVISVSPERYSHECLEHCGEFVLNFPSEEQAKGAWLCGTKSGRDIDKFEEGGFEKIQGKVKPPIIEGATVAYECKVVDKVKVGDHTLFVGEVVGMWGDPKKDSHLYTIHYGKPVSIDQKGNFNTELEYR